MTQGQRIIVLTLLRMINAPVFHVNAEDPEMVSFITKLALDYRMRYKKDVVYRLDVLSKTWTQ